MAPRSLRVYLFGLWRMSPVPIKPVRESGRGVSVANYRRLPAKKWPQTLAEPRAAQLEPEFSTVNERPQSYGRLRARALLKRLPRLRNGLPVLLGPLPHPTEGGAETFAQGRQFIFG